MTKRYLVLLAWLVTGFPSAAKAQQVGPDFQVNTYTTGRQGHMFAGPSVASDATGNFVVVWPDGYCCLEDGQDGSEEGVFARRYASDGTPLGGEFQVNTFTTGGQDHPSIASDASGNFIIVWSSDEQDGDSNGVFARRYDSTGNPLGDEFQVNTHTTNSQSGGEVAIGPSGSFAVVWTSFRQNEGFTDVFGQRYDSDGGRVGGEFQVNTYASHVQYDAQVAVDPSGNFVVVWTTSNMSSNYFHDNIHAQRYDSDGNRLGGEFRVNTHTGEYVRFPDVASDASGNFVVVWTNDEHPGETNYGISGQRYDRDGNRLGMEFQVNTYTPNNQWRPSVASDDNGSFVVVWQSDYQDGSRYGIFGQRFDDAGKRVGSEFRVNTYTSGQQYESSVASDSDGDFIVVWTEGRNFNPREDGRDGSATGVFGQRFSAGCRSTASNPTVLCPSTPR